MMVGCPSTYNTPWAGCLRSGNSSGMVSLTVIPIASLAVLRNGDTGRSRKGEAGAGGRGEVREGEAPAEPLRPGSAGASPSRCGSAGASPSRCGSAGASPSRCGSAGASPSRGGTPARGSAGASPSRYAHPPRGRVLELPRLAHGRGDQLVGLGVADELLLLRVPAQLAAQEHGDVVEVTDRRRSVAHLGRGHRLLATPDAVEEVALVAGAAAETLLELLRVRLQDGRVAGL